MGSPHMESPEDFRFFLGESFGRQCPYCRGLDTQQHFGAKAPGRICYREMDLNMIFAIIPTSI